MPGLNMPRPRFTAEDLDDERQRRKIISWLIQLDEQLRYLLNNLDAENLGEELRDIIQATAGAIELMAEGLEDTRAVVQMLPDQIRVAIDAIDEFETSGSEIVLTKDQAKIATPDFLIIITDAGDGSTSLHIDKDGAVMDYLTVNRLLTAPNMAEKYTGSGTLTVGTGGTFATLQAAFDTLNGKKLNEDVTIRLLSDTAENASLRNVTGGSVSLAGGNHSLTGGLNVTDCGARVHIDALKVFAATNMGAVVLTGDMFVKMTNCVIEGQGQIMGVNAGGGTRLQMVSCKLFNADTLISLYEMAELDAYGLAGGNCSLYLESNGGRWTWDGTRPAGSYYEDTNSLHNPADPDTLTVDSGGTAPTPAPSEVVTVSLTANQTGSYGSSWQSEQTMRQGRYSSTTYRGCMWWDVSALSGKTVLAASLKLKRKSGAGRSSQVSLNLWTTPLTGKSGNPATGAALVGTLGAIAPGEEMAYSLPTAAVQALVNGTAGGFMLYAGAENLLQNRDYSANYAAFDGTDGAAPELTVTYQ